MLQKLREEAKTMSGVSHEAVEKARTSKLFDRFGLETFKALSTSFYDRVFEDKGWFRNIFANVTKEAAIQNQFEFLVQEFGGPNLYAQRKGYTALLGRHGPYAITEQAATRWLEHMFGALDSTTQFDEDARQILRNYFRFMSAYIVIGKTLINSNRTVGYFGKHKQGEV